MFQRSKNSADLITIKESSTLSDAINKMLDYGIIFKNFKTFFLFDF